MPAKYGKAFYGEVKSTIFYCVTQGAFFIFEP